MSQPSCGDFFFSFFASRRRRLDPARTSVSAAGMPPVVVAGLQTRASTRAPLGKPESPS